MHGFTDLLCPFSAITISANATHPPLPIDKAKTVVSSGDVADIRYSAGHKALCLKKIRTFQRNIVEMLTGYQVVFFACHGESWHLLKIVRSSGLLETLASFHDRGLIL